MPRPPQPATGNLAYLQIRLPGWLKNQIITHTQNQNTTLNAWLIEAIQHALRTDLQLPPPPPAAAPPPTTADMIRQWATGQRTITPCGKTQPCTGQTQTGQWTHDGMHFCTECGIRTQ